VYTYNKICTKYVALRYSPLSWWTMYTLSSWTMYTLSSWSMYSTLLTCMAHWVRFFSVAWAVRELCVYVYVPCCVHWRSHSVALLLRYGQLSSWTMYTLSSWTMCICIRSLLCTPAKWLCCFAFKVWPIEFVNYVYIEFVNYVFMYTFLVVYTGEVTMLLLCVAHWVREI